MSNSTDLANVDQLFNGQAPRRYQELILPVAGHRVRLQSLTERELSAYQTATVASGGVGLKRSRLEDANRRMIVLCLVDRAGNRILNDSHIDRLADWDAADTSFLYDECAKHCGVNRQDIEDLAKNSHGTTVVDSPSDSPSE